MARLAGAAGAIVTALIVIIITVWHLSVSLVFALESAQFSAAGARAITGLIGLVVVALLALIARAMLHSRAAPRAPLPSISAAGDAAGQLGALVAERIVSATRSHPYGAVGTALVAGLAAGAIPELRKLVTGLLER